MRGLRADVLEPETLHGPGGSRRRLLPRPLDGPRCRRRFRRARPPGPRIRRRRGGAGVKRIVYLGGLGEGSEHLASRHETAEALRAGEVPVVYFRAAAVLGAGSESFRTAFYLVRRLPVMVTPRWVTTRTQPIAVADAVAYLAAAADLEPPCEREIQIGGPDVTTYGGMIDELARALGRRPPLRMTVPLLTPASPPSGSGW